MAAVARLPQGAVILPGYDADTPPAVWDRLGAEEAGAADHPQAGFRRLADAPRLRSRRRAGHGIRPRRPRRRATPSSPSPCARHPSPTSGAARATRSPRRSPTPRATLDWIEAPDARAEALAIALVLRRAAAHGERAALVTPDRTLARRVTAELDRWGLIPDDSAGRPLALTPPGVLLRLLATLAGAPLAPAALLALLKHPLVASAPGARRPHLAPRRPPRDQAPARRRPVDRLGRPRRLGRREPRRRALARLAPRRPSPPSPTRPPPPRRPRRPPPRRRRGPRRRAHRGCRTRSGRRRPAVRPARSSTRSPPRPAGGRLVAAEYRALFQSLVAARDVPATPPSPTRHRHLGHARGARPGRRPHRSSAASTKASGRGCPAPTPGSAARCAPPSACRAPSA